MPFFTSTRLVTLTIMALGIVAGLAVIYVTNPPQGNTPLAKQCKTSPAQLAALKEKATGAVAGVVVPQGARPLPELAFQNNEGQTVSLSDFKGKTVLLNLWATWCAPCRDEMPALNTLQEKFGSDDFEVVAVSVDTQGLDKSRAFLKEINADKLAFYASPDAGLFRNMQKIGRAVGLPTTLVIDETGCEIGYLPGYAHWADEDAYAFIRQIIPVTTP